MVPLRLCGIDRTTDRQMVLRNLSRQHEESQVKAVDPPTHTLLRQDFLVSIDEEIFFNVNVASANAWEVWSLHPLSSRV